MEVVLPFRAINLKTNAQVVHQDLSLQQSACMRINWRRRRNCELRSQVARLFSILLIFVIAGACMAAESRTPYIETFDHGAGGWIANRRDPLPIWDGAAYCISPWFLDPNHAPPGAGYLHLLMYLTTGAKWLPHENAENRFIEQRKSPNLLNARFTLRSRGLFDLSEETPNPIKPRLGEVPMGLQGSQLLLLVQAETQKTTANFVLTGQPFQIRREWSEQTVVLKPDPKQWTCLGSRHDLADVYGCDEIAEVLRDVNVDLILVLFPLKVIPTGEIADLHRPRAGEDYPVRQEVLPKGLLMVDTVKIEYPWWSRVRADPDTSAKGSQVVL